MSGVLSSRVFSRILAILTCLMLGISMISPAFVHADEPSPTPTEAPELDDIDILINGMTPDQMLTAVDLVNKLAMGYSLDVEDAYDGFTLLGDLFFQETANLISPLFSDDQQRWVSRNFQLKSIDDSYSDYLKDMPLTSQDLSNALAGRSIYAQGINNITENAPEQLRPYLDALTLSTLQISTACRDLGADRAGATYNYSYDASLYSVLASAGPRTVYTGDSSYIRRGILDFYSRDLVTQLPLYVMDPSESSLYSGPGYDDLYDTGLNIATCATRYALLIPENPSQSPACIYDNGILQRIEFNLYNDNIRSAYDISQPLSSILPLTGDVFYTSSDGSYTYTQNKTIGCEFYCNGNSFIPLISGLGSSGGPYSTTSVYTGFTYGIDPYPGYDDTTKILMFLSGYFRNVDIYLGDSWATATPLVGPRGFSFKPQDQYTYPDDSGSFDVITTPSEGLFDLYAFLRWFFSQDFHRGDTITINTVPNVVFIPVPSQDNPNPTAQPLITDVPADTPIPTEYAVYPPWIPGDVMIPLESEDYLNQGGIFSNSVADMFGVVTPPPTRASGGPSFDGDGDGNDDTEYDSASDVATGLMTGTSYFLGPFTTYIWYAVGLCILVSLIIKILHS